jgi:hypothetical protein
MGDIVIFPIGKEAEADAYLAFCNEKNPDVGKEFYPADKVDTFGQRVVGFLGETGFIWEGKPFPEPEGGVKARQDGVLWPGDLVPETKR